MDDVSNFAAHSESCREKVLSLQDYLDLGKRAPWTYATTVERMRKETGEQELIEN